MRRSAVPCRAMEMAQSETGINEFGRFSDIPSTTKFASMDATSTKNSFSGMKQDPPAKLPKMDDRINWMQNTSIHFTIMN